MSLAFEAAKRRADATETRFTLDGEEYHFKPPKTTAMSLASTYAEQVRAVLNWLERGLPEHEAQRIRDRLFDLDDDLDGADLMRVANGILEEMAGRPTTPSSD